VIYFDRGNVVDLRPNTRVALGSITLFFGEMFARIVDVATHGGGQVLTDELAASVEGTQYAVRRAVTSGYGSNSAGSTAVIVRDGHVRCAPRGTGTWPAVAVGANFVLRVEGPRMLGPPGPIDAVAETRWSEEVERRLLGPRRAVSGASVWLPTPRPRPRSTPPPPSRPAGTSGPG
jgi:ferric-dicitrate binding protein FerR (iron transport regulator)